MTEDRLIELLARGSPDAVPAANACPDDLTMTAYIVGALDPGACHELERHLASCSACRDTVGAVLRFDAAPDVADTILPEFTLARTKRLVGHRRRVSAPIWAAAATVLLAAGIVLLAGLPGRDVEVGDDMRATRQSRLVPQERVLPRISVPPDAATVRTSDFEVRWSAVPDARYYDVRIVDDDGDLVLTQRVTGTAWTPSAPLDLAVGAEYYVRVDAYVDDAKPQSSQHVSVTIAP